MNSCVPNATFPKDTLPFEPVSPLLPAPLTDAPEMVWRLEESRTITVTSPDSRYSLRVTVLSGSEEVILTFSLALEYPSAEADAV